MGLERKIIRRLKPYTPGEQPDPALQSQIIKLNTNENPYPPSVAVLDALRAVDAETLRRYPSPTALRFRQVAAGVHGLSPSHVIATNGGDELLRLAITVFCDPRRQGPSDSQISGLGICVPTYSLYEVLAAIHDTPVVRIPLAEAFALPVDLAERLNREGVQLAIITNPHAPSGHLEAVDRLDAVAKQFRGVVLIDEAYVDFANRDALSLLLGPNPRKNVLLLRSLSKGYGLAGLRVGYGLGDPQLIATLVKVRDSYNTDVLSQVAAVAALEHRDEAAQTWRTVIKQRQWLHGELVGHGFRVFPSEANFLLVVPPPTGPEARVIYESLEQRGVLVRYFDQDRLCDKLRITVGTPEQNRELLAALDEII